MKVLMITPVFDTGGTEVYILNLIQYLKDSNCEVMLITGDGKRKTILSEKNIKFKLITSLSRKKIYNFIMSVIKVYKELKQFKPNIIHTSSIFTTIISKCSSFIYNLIYKEKVKVVITLHGGPNKNIENDYAKILNIFADKVIALSEKSKISLVENGLSKEKVKVIYNGIDVKYERNDDIKSDNIIEVLVCGRLTEQKGHIYLLKAITILSKKYSNIRLLILGDGELRDELENEIDKYNIKQYVKFLGFKENVYKYIQRADIFVLPSLWEQFPISILEAMYFGKPIIASDVNGIREQIDNCGILIKPADENQIVESISLLIENKEMRENMSINAKKRFEENFTLDKMGNKTIAVYKNILNNKTLNFMR